MLAVRLLGQFDVQLDGKSVEITSRSAQSFLAYLMLNPGTEHRREKLAGLFWSNTSDENARRNLRQELWRLRQALESKSPRKRTLEYFITDDISIAFNSNADFWLDTAVLQGPTQSTNDLLASVNVYRGELLPGVYDDWAVLERERLQSVYEQKMARLLEHLQDEQRWDEILDWSERWIALGQTPEPAYRALMLAHHAKGDQSQVASIYQRCIAALRNELGVEPSAETRALFEQLSKGESRIAPAPTLRSAPLFGSTNLPVPLTSFIGREKELQTIARLLSTSRLITLTGPGGVGKTRLAIQIAHDSIKKFKDGVFWVGLVGLADENLIPQEIAQALKVREISNEPLIDTLKHFLKSKEILLVIDNCEHLIRACAHYIEQLLVAAPKMKILATSIEGLGLFDETIYQVPSLPLPQAQELSLKELERFASIELFNARASHAKPDFSWNEKNASSIAQICQRLDGIPLAIELAAARIKVLSIDEIAARLDDRFSLLTAGSRTAIPRHQTLRATIDWSYDLLTESERILFRRLSVFAGGFTLEAAESVCSLEGLHRSEILDLLGRLADKSLVIVEGTGALGQTRYRLLETIRQYAIEKLIATGEASATRDLHLEFYLALAEKAEALLFGKEQAPWIRRLDIELDNVRAVIDWATSTGKADIALRIAGALVYYWFAHRLAASEWQDWVQKALARPEGKRRTLARAKALNAIGFVYFGDVVLADRRPELEEALSIAKEFDDQLNTATALRNLGLMENVKGNYVEARGYLEASLSLWREMGSAGKIGYAWTLIFLGDVALNRGETELSRTLYEEVVAILRSTGDLNFLAYAIRRLGQLLWREGNYAQAAALCKESLDLNLQVSSPRGVMGCLAGFAAIAVAQGKYQSAAQLIGAIESQMVSQSITPMYMDQQEYARTLARLHAKLDKKTLGKYWAKGKAMMLDETIAFALDET